ncbi:biotin carboxylase N-terminal domain-containing protein [Propioniciclava sinopodophylli]|uniref:ATP-binding protein n=1 Tax=Propioniciclava sinopodophylli TaxID=1837344 RepID=UPI00240DC3ED|nr:biotin carboxylase N-terminal domain-containing protein [Propioniciclava sinopodophylli]
MVVQRALRRTESTSCGSTSGTGTSSSGGADHRRGQSRGTCTELGIKTVAVFPYGERGNPVRAYLDIEGIVRAAKEAHAHAIYPGHGFLSENAGLASRHQKVVELAPAPNLDPALRDQICADAVRFARHIGYSTAGTVEFLLGQDGRYVFIEMNPRSQVEHTVTEEVTNVDLVFSQMRIAAGETLASQMHLET